MSARVADGWSSPCSQSVSVVPMIQWSPQGNTNSTLFSVGRMSARSESMHALGTTTCTPFDGRTDEGITDAGEALQLGRPDAGGVDDDAGADLELVALLEVDGAERRRSARRRAENPVTSIGRHAGGAVVEGRAGQGDGEPGIVHLRVEVADTAGQRVVAQGRHGTETRAAREVAVTRHRRRRARERVVQKEARAHERAVTQTVLQREEEGRGVHQVGGERLHQQSPLVERFAHQSDVEPLQVAQTPVDQLARPARRAGGEVTLLDERDGEAAAGGVERDAASGDTAADDEHVEVLACQASELAPAGILGRRPPGHADP